MLVQHALLWRDGSAVVAHPVVAAAVGGGGGGGRRGGGGGGGIPRACLTRPHSLR